MNKVKNILFPMDWETVLTIPLNISERRDKWVWHFDKCGVYSVKSGYNTTCLYVSNCLSSFESGWVRWWKKLWEATIPSKVNMFLLVTLMAWKSY